MISPHSVDNKGAQLSQVSPDPNKVLDSMTGGGLPSINENQSKLTDNGPEAGASPSQMDMGMDDDSMMKEESRMSARGKEGEQKSQMKMTGNSFANDSILSKEPPSA